MLFAVSLNAETLFVNTHADPGRANVAYNRYSNSDSALRHFALTKVDVTGAGWTVDSMTTYFNHTGIPTLDGVHVHVVPEADLASFDPTNLDDTTTAGTFTQLISPSFFNSGLLALEVDMAPSISLAPGSYWIGMTPIGDDPSALNGLGFATRGAADLGFAEYAVGPDAVINTSVSPTMHDVWQTDTPSVAILIEGSVVPEPAAGMLALLGFIALIGRRRR